MGAVQVEFDQDLVDLLEELHRPVKQAARELIVLELYRQGEISSGKAAELLGVGREQFIRQASERGIPYFQLDREELQRELSAPPTSGPATPGPQTTRPEPKLPGIHVRKEGSNRSKQNVRTLTEMEGEKKTA